MRQATTTVTIWMLLAATVATAGCSKKSSPAAGGKAEAGAARADAAATTAPAASTREHRGLRWYDDAPEAALAEAKRTGKPVLVDLWAPWCHTCIAMQSYILTAENLPGAAERYIFLAVDTEKPESAPFLEKVPVEVWPTFYVLGPDGEIRGRWLGAASPSQFQRFLDDGVRAVEAAAAGALPEGDPLALLLAGDELAAKKQHADAAGKYAAAVATAPADWPRRPDALSAQINALRQAGDHGACVELGLQEIEKTGNLVSAADFAAYMLMCAQALPEKDPRRKRAIQAAEAKLAALCDDTAAPLSPDDRADVCRYLWDARETLGDVAGAKAAAQKRLAIMEVAAKQLPDDLALMYDWARAESYLFLDRPDEAIGLLEAREKALPKNYNPPHYLARTFNALKRWDEGLLAIDRAIALAYGPRKAGMYSLKVDLLMGAGKKAEAKAALEQQLAEYQALPAAQKQPKREQAIQQRLAEWK